MNFLTEAENAALRARYAGNFPVPALSCGTVRDYCDSSDHLPKLATCQGDLKDLQRPWMIKALLGGVPAGGRLLEIGGGEPLVSGMLAELGYEATLVDPYDGSGSGPLEYEVFVQRFPAVRIIRGILQPGLPELAGELFDAIYSVSVLEHVPPEALASLFAAVGAHLRPGGLSIHCIDCVTQGNGDAFHREQCARVDGLQRSLAGVPAPSEGDVETFLAQAEGELDTYYLSAAGHNLWRGSTPYHDFPFRKVLSFQTSACRLTEAAE